MAEENGQKQIEVSGVEGSGASVRASGKSVARSLLWDMVVAVLVSGFIIMFLYQPVRVEGTSMLPMLEDQDRLFVSKLAYHVGEIHRGRCSGVSVSA